VFNRGERSVILPGRAFDDKPAAPSFAAQSAGGHRPVRIRERGGNIEAKRRARLDAVAGRNSTGTH